MTWEEIKGAIEAQGIKNEDNIIYIDISTDFSNDANHIRVNKDNPDYIYIEN